MLSNGTVAGDFPDALLASIPQTAPFRFVDHVIEGEKNELIATATIAAMGVHIA